MKERAYQSMALRALNVDPGEFALVRALFFHYFFQGFGIALITIIATAAFLREFSASSLPLVYMVSALVLFGFGRCYAILEHRLSLQKLFSVVALAIAMLAVASWIGLAFAPAAWLIFSLMVLYRVVYLLGNLEFWGLSAVVFDVRQSKRLFGLIGAGYVPAKLLGYLSVSVLAPFVGIANILGIGAASFVISFFFLRSAIRNADLDESHAEHAEEHTAPAGIVARIFGTDFVLALAMLSFVVILVLTTIDYAFLSELKYKFKKDVDFAAFLGMFFAIGQGITIFMEIFLSGRIVNRVGVRGSLLFLPVALLLICLVLFVENLVWHQDKAVFWFFGIMVLTCDVLQYVLNSPVFLAMFQPLERHRRLQGHTVVKGMTDPISLGLAGAVLFILIELKGGKGIPLELLGAILTGLVIVWILAIHFVNRKYLEMLRKAIQNRYLDGAQLEIADKKSIEILKRKLKSDYAEEVVYALELLRNVELEKFPEIVIELLDHPVDEVVIHALQLVEELEITEANDKLSEMINQRESGPVAEAVVRAYCRTCPSELDTVIPFLGSADCGRHSGAIEGLMHYGGVEGIVAGGQELLRMIDSEIEDERVRAARTIGQLGIERLHRPLEQLFQDSSFAVKREAIRASAKVKSPKLLPALLGFLDDVTLRREAVSVIPAFGSSAVMEIRRRLDSPVEITSDQTHDLIRICEKIGSDEARELLLQWSDADCVEHRDASWRALHLNGFHAANSSEWAGRLELALDDALAVLLATSIVNSGGESEMLREALKGELHFARKRLFLLLGFLYDRNSMIETQRELEFTDRERRANALEALDNLLPKSISNRFFALIETHSTGTLRTHQLLSKAKFRTTGDVVDHILTSGRRKYSRWLIASAIDAVRHLKMKNLVPAVLPFADHREVILGETAVHALRELADDPKSGLESELKKRIETIMQEKSEPESKLLEIEKVIILKTSPLFAETPSEILVDIANIVKEERFEKGQEIFARNDVGDFMYIIYKGEVRISHEEKTVAVLKRRDIVGELALLDPEPRSATAVADSDCLLLRLDQGPFFELIDERSEVGRGVLKVLCRRLRNDLTKIEKLEAQVETELQGWRIR